jgi:flagella basal body P-ring formation protein FlgA
MIRNDGKILFVALMICLIGSLPAFGKANNEEIVMQKIREHIQNNMPWPAENVRIEFLSGMPKVADTSGQITFSIESKAREEYIGDTSFRVRIFSKQIFTKEESVRVRIEVLREFVVSQDNISRDSIISTNDVNVQKKWVRSIPMNALSSIDEAVGKNLIVSVRPNTQMMRSMLKEVMPVKKGRMVQVILDNGMMKMIMRGMAEEDGAEDSMVRVRNLNSNKIIYARVVGRAKVQVDF